MSDKFSLLLDSDLLRQVDTVAVGGVKSFVVADHFRTDNAEVLISEVNAEFEKFFLDKIEEDVKGITLNVYRLESGLLGLVDLANLGDRAEISLAHVWELLKKQPTCRELGVLNTLGCSNGPTNLFFGRGTDDNLRVVCVHGYGRAWGIYAGLLEIRRILLGSKIFSRNP